MKAIRKLWLTLTIALTVLLTAIAPTHAQTTAGSGADTANMVAQVQAAGERILNYDIKAVIDKDAKMTVTERITVNVTNQRIRHGISRTYPIKRRMQGDDLHTFGFKLLSTTLDGQKVDCKESESGLLQVLLLGSAKTFVPKGVHTYEIVYETTGHVRSLEKHDEIYYNAIGLDVLFPVEKATFSLTLPDGTKPLLTKAYTGPAGSRGADYKMTGDMTFETTAMLKPHEAFTVVVGWKKGIVTIPDDQPWAGTHRTAALLICVLVVVLILALGWNKHFRRRFKGVVYPVFTPPADLTPGKAAFYDGRFEEKSVMLQADLIWSAIKGYCRLNPRDKRGAAFIWTGRQESDTKRCYWCADHIPADATTCPKCERQQPDAADTPKKPVTKTKRGDETAADLSRKIFGGRKTIILGYEDEKKTKVHSSLVGAWRRLHDYYDDTVRGVADLVFGHALTALIIGQIMLMYFLGDIWYEGLAHRKPTTVAQMFYLPALPAIFAIVMLIGIAVAWKMYLGKPVVRYSVCAVIAILFLLAAGVIWFLVGDTILTVTYLLLWGLPLGFFYRWNLTPNKESQATLQVTEGLKMYINTAEKHRLEAINAPEDSVKQYEAILPYAIALGCADAWEKRYEPILNELNYLPDWVAEDKQATANFETWDERQMRRYEQQQRRELFATIAMTDTTTHAIAMAIEESEETRRKASDSSSSDSGSSWSSSGGSSGSSSSGSSGGGSGGGGVGGW